jgi:hypothetical protein
LQAIPGVPVDEQDQLPEGASLLRERVT